MISVVVYLSSDDVKEDYRVSLKEAAWWTESVVKSILIYPYRSKTKDAVQSCHHAVKVFQSEKL